MTEQTFTDETLREVISQLEFDEPERSVYADSQIGQFNLPEINASIIYKFNNGLVIQGKPLTVKKLEKHYDHKNRVSLEDCLEYEAAEKKMNAQIEAANQEYQKQYDTQLEIWKREHPDWEKSNEREITEGGQLLIPLAAVTKPTLRQAGHPVGGPEHKLGILIESYGDKECLTAQLESATIRYMHEDGTMNYKKLQETTDITEEDLPKIRAKLCERYDVKTGSKGGKWFEEKYPRIMVPMETPQEYRNNFFVAELTPEMSIEEMVTAINNVYEAGEAFREGVYKLQEQRRDREAAEAKVVEEKQKSVLSAF